MNDYYFYVAPDEEGLGWEFTISDLIESEFEAKPEKFPDKSAKIEFLKELIADIKECIEKVEKDGVIVVWGNDAEWDIFVVLRGKTLIDYVFYNIAVLWVKDFKVYYIM